MTQLSRPSGNARQSLWEFTQDKRGNRGTPGLLLGEIGKTIEAYNQKYSPIKQTRGQTWLTDFMPGGAKDDYSDFDPNKAGRQAVTKGHQNYGHFGMGAYGAAKDAGYSPAQIFQGLAGAWGGEGIKELGPAMGGTGRSGNMYDDLKDWKGAGNWLLGYMGPSGGFGIDSYNQVRKDIPGYQTPRMIEEHLKQSGFRPGSTINQPHGMKDWLGGKVDYEFRNDPFNTYVANTGTTANYDPNTGKAKPAPITKTNTQQTNTQQTSTKQQSTIASIAAGQKNTAQVIANIPQTVAASVKQAVAAFKPVTPAPIKRFGSGVTEIPRTTRISARPGAIKGRGDSVSGRYGRAGAGFKNTLNIA